MKKRKDDREYTKKEFKGLKRKLLSAFTMFLVATILMTSTSYAWLVLSVAPEVSGISTNIGANGSLEMALLTTETRADLSTIRTAVGESLAQRNPSANNTWGNLVDLSYSEYGLENIVLMPSRLNIVPGADGYSVDTNLISVPSYGYDGRIIELNDETMSAVYNNENNGFSLVMGSQDYGVRAIGTANTLSVQASALALAKANISSYTNSAKSTTSSILGSYGDTLFDIVLTHSMDAEATYGDTELDALKAMIGSTNDVADYIDRAIRQGIIAVAASEIADKATFTAVRDRVMDTSKDLGTIMGNLAEVGEIPAEFTDWVTALSEMQNDINAANNAANELSGGSYTWEQFRNILDYVMNVDGVYINDKPFSEFGADSAGDLIGGTVTLTLAPGSGVFADFADFIDNYSSVMTAFGTNIEIKTATSVNPSYLTVLSSAVKGLEAADGGSSEEGVSLNTTYGYAIDLAFRCNASTSDLLLQTTPEHRIYDGTETGSAMGGGSYMEFSTKDDTFAPDKMIQLMDAVRVTFIDDKNNILGIAKLNTSNREILEDGIKAALYLYEYSLSEEDGSVLMGERLKTENTITSLEQNVAKAITAIVWLDGDIVDNTMVSATEEASLTGVLNLQFASSADLVPANNNELLNITADKTELEAALTGFEEKIAAGQGTYTTVSWEAFISAYNYAVAVNQNPNANDSQVYFAAYELAKADSELEFVSADAVKAKISEVREITGTSENIVRYVVENEDGSRTAVEEDHTQEEHDNWKNVGYIYQVDYQNNLHDEGNELYTQIYTDESWVALANALYDAEETAMNPKATDAQLNSALTALEDAKDNLQRKVFYTPYEYNGEIYYEAICNANDADTYGKWYDSDFKRIVADITILNLDAYAEPTEFFEMVLDEYAPWTYSEITPYVDVLDEIYPELRDVEIAGMHWNSSSNPEYYTELMKQHHIDTIQQYIDIVKAEGFERQKDEEGNYLPAENEKLIVDIAEAEAIVADFYKNPSIKVTVEKAESVIATLNEKIAAALDEKYKVEEDPNPAMTDTQRILLNTAVTRAKAVEGYSDTEKAELNSLRAAVAKVENVLAAANATKDEATEVLDEINAALKGAKAKEVTEYNTITHSVPVFSEIQDVVYKVDYPGMILGLSGKTGDITLSAVILTENGVVGTVSKKITVYTPFDHVRFSDDSGWIYDEHPANESDNKYIYLTKGFTKTVSAEVYYHFNCEDISEEIRQKAIDLGNIVDGKVKFKETVKSYTWASYDTEVATVTDNGDGSCTVTAKELGSVGISVSVETYEGNIYTYNFIVVVTSR